MCPRDLGNKLGALAFKSSAKDRLALDAWSLPCPCLAGAAHPCSSVPMQQLMFGVPVSPSLAMLSLGNVYAAPWQGKNQASAGPSAIPCIGLRQTFLSPTPFAQSPLTSQRLILQPEIGVPFAEQVIGTEKPSTYEMSMSFAPVVDPSILLSAELMVLPT